MYERLVITLIVVMITAMSMWFLRRWQLKHAQDATQRLGITTDIPTIVYFWSTTCRQCKNIQKPILQQLIAECGAEHVQLITYNVEESADVATAWGVRTVPTTFIVDRSGEVLHVNNGLATEGALRRQLKLQKIVEGSVQ